MGVGVLTWLLKAIGGPAAEKIAEFIAASAALHWIDTHPGLFATIFGGALFAWMLWRTPSQQVNEGQIEKHPAWYLVFSLIFNIPRLVGSVICLALVLSGLADMTGWHRFVGEAPPPVRLETRQGTPIAPASTLPNQFQSVPN